MTQQLRVIGLRARCGPVRLFGQELLVMPRYDMGQRAIALGKCSNWSVGSISRLGFGGSTEPALQGDRASPAHGRRDGWHGPYSVVDVELSTQEAGFATSWLPLPLDQIRAKIRASTTVVQVERLEGRLGPIGLTAGGTVTSTKAGTLADLRLSAVAQSSRTGPALRCGAT
ncbi:MAG: hypothetical protein U0231_03070 [Nitrospiraceae bacterium]